MADNENFDPTESLGPSFGGINQPSINPDSFKPFEGEPLSFPTITFPKALGTGSLTNNSDLVRDIVHTRADAPIEDKIKAYVALLSASAQASAPDNSSSKIFSYDASPDGNAFYKRYAAYGDEKFAKIGFSPFRDNEAIFNARTSMWDDSKRMMQHSFWPLFSSGFVAGPKSLMKMISGDFSADPEEARIYADAAAIGQSSKSGFGAFMNNTAMNFAYTAGIISEAIIEEGVGLLLAAPTGGASLAATTANNARKIPLLFRGLKGLSGMGKMSKSMAQTLKQVDNIGGARTFFDAARSKAGRFFNPLENITEAAYDITQNADNLTGMARGFAAVNKTAGGFYRDVRNINMALSEARLEGGFVQNDVYDNLYNDFVSKHGEAPDDKLQRKMRNKAKEASIETVKWNTALIYGSNKIVIPNIMGPRGGIRNFAKSKMAQELGETSAGKIIATPGEKIAGKLYKPEFSIETKGWKSSWNSFKRKPLTTGALGLGNYFKANFTEGLQENAQEVIGESLKNYYTESFKNPEMAAHLYSKGVFQEALNEQFSAQGFETFAGGFFMGMFAAPLNHSIPAMSIGFNKLTDPKGYAKMKAERNQRGQRVVDNLNAMTADPNVFFDSKLFNYAVQGNVKDGIAAGTDKEGLDLREEAFITQINTAIENNTLDHFLDHIQSFSQLSVDEFEEALGYEKGKGAEKQQEIGRLVSKAKDIEKRHKYYSERFPDQVSMEGLEVGTNEYNAAAIYKNARHVSIRNAVFFGESFDNTLNRMNGVMSKIADEVGLKNVSVSDIQNMFDNERMDNEAEILKTEVESLKLSTDPAAKRKLGDKQRKLDSYNRFNKASIDFQKWVKKQRYDSESLANKSKEEIEKEDTKTLTEFELAYKEHLRTLGELAKDHVFDENLDKSFELLLDHYKLEDEAAHLGQYVNFLHDPKNFTDNIERNYEWMYELYNNRAEHYDTLVKKGMADVENNDLLNKLANKDIYISKEDLENFVENNVIPEEFHKGSDKSVIRRTHPLYDQIRNEFLSLVESRKDTEFREYIKEAKEKIDALNSQRDEEIAALPTTDTKESLGSIPKLKLKKLTVKRIDSELKDGEYAEAKDAEGNISIFYKDGDVLKHDDIDGNPVRLDSVKDKFESVDKYKIVKTPDAEAVKAINEKYDLLSAEVLQNAIKNSQEAGANEFIPITASTPIEELPISLKEELLEGVPNYMEELGLIGQPEEHLVNYMREAEAEAIINAYNDKQEALFMARQEGTVEARDLPKGNKMVSSTDMSLDELETLRKDFYNKVQETQSKEELTPEETLALAKDQEMLDYLDRYILFRKTSLFSDKAKKSIEKIEYLKSIQDRITLTPYGYVINGKLHTRVTQSFESLKTNKYELSEDIIAKIEAAYFTTIGEGKSIDEFIDKLSKSNIPAFSLFTAKKLNAIAMDVVARRAIKSNTPGLKEIRAEIANLETEIDSAKGQDGYTEILNNNKQKIKELTLKLPLTEKQGLALIVNEIKEKTYEETRIGGNQIDGLLKDFFDNIDAPFEYKPEYAKIIRDKETGDIISAGIQEDAFNSLFGEPTVENPKGGFLYELREKVKSGQLYVAPAIKVYDSTALNGKGVAGEIDLLVVDQEGNASIVDVKTGKKNKWNGFRTLSGPEASRSESAMNKYEDYSMQQTSYSNLLFNMTGIDADINILPIETSFEEGDTELGKVLTAQDPGINKGGPWYSLKRTESIDTIIPRTTGPIVTDNTPADVLTEEQKETMAEPMGQTDDSEERTSLLDGLKLDLAYEEAAVESGFGSQELVDDLKAKIAELEPTQQIETIEEVEAKKADIEKNKELTFVNSLPIDTNISISELNKLGIINSSLFGQSLHNIITSFASKLNIKVRFTNGIVELNSKAGGNFDTNTGVITININALYDSYQNQLQGKGRAGGTLLGTKSLESFEQFVQNTITHELIHSVTQNAYDNAVIDIAKKKIGKSIKSLEEFKKQLGGLANRVDAENIYNEVIKNGYSNTSNLNQTQIDALSSIGNIFNYLNTLDSNKYFGGKEYGLVNMSELMAELSNEGFVSALQRIELPQNLRYSSKNKNVFESIISFIADLFTGKKVSNNAADSLFASLSDIITSPQFYNFLEGSFTNNSANTVQDKINAKYNAELATLEDQQTSDINTKADIEKRRQEAKNKIYLKPKLQEALLRDKEELDRTGKVDNRASSALQQMIKNKEDEIDKEYDNIILKEFGELEYKKTKILRDKKNLEEYFSKTPTKDYIELENREKRLAKYDAELVALEEQQIEEVTEERKEITLLDVETMAKKVNSPERLNELKAYLSQQFLIGNIEKDVYDISDRIIEERLIQIEKGISLELSLDTLVEGQQLMVKNDIFTGSNNKLASVNDTVIVKSTANGKLTVALYGRPNVTKVVSEADINKYFTTMDLEKAKAKVADQPLTKEDKEVIKENDDMLDSFLKDGDRLDTLRKEASNQSLKDIEDTLLDELDC